MLDRSGLPGFIPKLHASPTVFDVEIDNLNTTEGSLI